jgi:tetratricopeptide (TPR) repeat protein
LFCLIIPACALALEVGEFQALMSDIQSKNYVPVESFLKLNQETMKKDPEYFVVLLNHVLSKGYESSLVIEKGMPQAGDLELRNKDTGEIAGFIGSRPDENLILGGISQTQAAHKYFKSRLDIHFGIVTAAERIGRWDIVGDQLVAMLEISKEINNQWILGPVGSMSGKPKDFMIQNILPRTASLFRVNSEIADKAFIKVSQKLIDIYPELIYGCANLGVLYLAKKEYSLAEKYLKQASQVDPNDEIVRGNLKKLRDERK